MVSAILIFDFKEYWELEFLKMYRVNICSYRLITIYNIVLDASLFLICDIQFEVATSLFGKSCRLEYLHLVVDTSRVGHDAERA